MKRLTHIFRKDGYIVYNTDEERIEANKVFIRNDGGSFFVNNILNNYELLKMSNERATTKLGRLEDIEERLGCPIEVLFRALKEGIYAREDNSSFYKYKMQKVRGLEIDGLSVISEDAPYPECDWTCYYKDYKMTWWLKEDKSE